MIQVSFLIFLHNTEHFACLSSPPMQLYHWLERKKKNFHHKILCQMNVQKIKTLLPSHLKIMSMVLHSIETIWIENLVRQHNFLPLFLGSNHFSLVLFTCLLLWKFLILWKLWLAGLFWRLLSTIHFLLPLKESDHDLCQFIWVAFLVTC